jgi:hypothetical protein
MIHEIHGRHVLADGPAAFGRIRMRAAGVSSGGAVPRAVSQADTAATNAGERRRAQAAGLAQEPVGFRGHDLRTHGHGSRPVRRHCGVWRVQEPSVARDATDCAGRLNTYRQWSVFHADPGCTCRVQSERATASASGRSG